MVGYALLLHLLLLRQRRAVAGVVPKRLLLLRVFGVRAKRERLLDVLDDTWRRVGRIDLIAGSDLAMRTFGSLTLEAMLLRRTDARYLQAATEVRDAISRLRSRLEGDLRWPVNELYCYAAAWPEAMMRLAEAADVIVLDLRGYTEKNVGCTFELAWSVQSVPLERLVVLVDAVTDGAKLRSVAMSAWAARPSATGVVDIPGGRARLRVLRVDRRSARVAVPPAVFAAAFAGAG